MSSCGAYFFSLLFLINFARKKGGNMAELTNEQKKAWAKTLYTRETLTQRNSRAMWGLTGAG